jgi:hypothetical protein
MVILLLKVHSTRMPMIQSSFVALSAYLLTTPIFAPQFAVTLVPLMAVLALEGPLIYFFAIFNALIVLTWFTAPTWVPTFPWTVPHAFGPLGLSVAAGSRHSPLDWLRLKLGRPVRSKLPPVTRPADSEETPPK